jgi:hypothetical protein
MARLQSGTRVYGTANVDGNLSIGGTSKANLVFSFNNSVK